MPPHPALCNGLYGSEGGWHSPIRVESATLQGGEPSAGTGYGSPPLRRRVLIAALVGVPLAALAAAAAVAWWPSSLPDPLRDAGRPSIAGPGDVAAPATSRRAWRADGDLSLRFTASIGNVGEGPFIVHAVRADDRGDWRVSQRFRERAGPTSEVPTEGDLIFGGHGHEHWHVHARSVVLAHPSRLP